MFYLTQEKLSCVFCRSKKGEKEEINEKIVVGLYPCVSIENQSKFEHSLDEQEDKLRKLCDFKDYKIYKVYREEGASAKNMNCQSLKNNDMKQGHINKIIVYKLDRLTRSIKDLETICFLLEEYNCGLESVLEEINTDTANREIFCKNANSIVTIRNRNSK